jgi:hypothetical protein
VLLCRGSLWTGSTIELFCTEFCNNNYNNSVSCCGSSHEIGCRVTRPVIKLRLRKCRRVSFDLLLSLMHTAVKVRTWDWPSSRGETKQSNKKNRIWMVRTIRMFNETQIMNEVNAKFQTPGRNVAYFSIYKERSCVRPSVRVCMCVCVSHLMTTESFDGFLWNMVWTSCRYRPPYSSTF